MNFNKIQHWFAIAESVAQMSKDEETRVGALLVDPKDGAILALAYNGFVRGAPDDELPKRRPDKYEYMLHAELNLLTNCARHGISMNDKIVVCTHSPCKQCIRLLANAGINEIYFKYRYKDFEETLKLKDVKVNLYTTAGVQWLELNITTTKGG